MKRALLLYAGISLCFTALGLQADEQPLAKKVDHIFVTSDRARTLFAFFKDTLHLPEFWPFNQSEEFSSGGLSLGNVVLEFVSFPKVGNEPQKTEFQGIAFEPTLGADAIVTELARREIPHSAAQPYKFQMNGRVLAEWKNVLLSDMPPTNAVVFFCDYKGREAVTQGQKAMSDELVKRGGGPLGIVGLAEMMVGVRDLEDARSKWRTLLEPSPQISEDSFIFNTGPRIRLVHTESPGIQGIILRVRSIGEAEKFLKERQLLAKDDFGHIAISPAAIEGLTIRLIDDVQERMSAHPLLGTGRGVDHVGIGVRDLEKAKRDYEQVLGFKCTENLPPGLSGRTGLRSMVFFEDETLLEFLSPPQNSSAIGEEFRDWVEKHEGAMSLGLETSSARDAVAYLEAHNFEVKLTEWPRATKEGEAKPSPVRYYSVTTPDIPSGNKKIFLVWIWLVEYVSPKRLAARREQGLMDHPNTAQHLHSVWFAVRDLDAGLRKLQDAGFEPGEVREEKHLGAKGQEVKAGNGCMLLLRSADKNGALEKFLSNHDDGEIIGISIEVSDLNKARAWVEGHSGHKLEPYNGFYGQSIMIPPDLTHGIWIELFQRE